MSETLTDEQIDRLLVEAEARLRERSSQVLTSAVTAEISLETGEVKGKSRKPYVSRVSDALLLD